MTYDQFEYWVAAALLVFSMIGMGAALTVADFVAVLRGPHRIVLVLVAQCVGAPLLAILVARLLAVHPGVAIGMLVVSALPGGSYTNLMTYLGHGNVALSVSATTICTACCVVTTPLVLRVFGGESLPTEFAMPVGLIFADIGRYLLLPLAVGMTMRRLMPVHHAALARWCVRFSLVMLAAIVIGSIVSGRLHVAAHGWRMPLALFLLASGSLWLTYFACLLTRQSMTDAFTMGVEVLVRNGNLGLLLKASLFPAGGGPQEIGDAVLYTILLYAGISLGVAVVEVWGHRNQTGLMFGWRRRT